MDKPQLGWSRIRRGAERGHDGRDDLQFLFNNQFTYRDQRLSGLSLLRGLLIFYLICEVGGIANVGVASYAFTSSHTWWLAGVAGAVVGSVWNFAMSSVLTRRRR
jgi:dolichol-phosphate mannosyltransferase